MNKLFSIKLCSIFIILSLSLTTFAEEANTVEPKETIVGNGHPLSLSEAIRLSLMNSFDIHIARLERKASAQDIPAAKAIYDTNLSLDFDYTVDEKESPSTIAAKKSNTTNWSAGLSKKFLTGTLVEFDFFNTRSSSPSMFATLNPNYSSGGELSFTQPIMKNFFGLLDRGDVKLVKLDVSKLDLEILDRIEQQITDVEKTYWDLSFAHGNLAAKRRAFEVAQDFLRITKDQFDNGAVEETDLFAAQANVAKKDNELLQAEQDLSDRSDDLKLAMNFFPEFDFIPTDTPLVRDITLDEDTLFSSALERSRAYAAQKIELEKRSLTLKMNSNKRWPQLDLEATFTSNGLARDMIDAVGEVSGVDDNTYFVGATLSIPLENRKARAEYKQADYEKAQALWTLKRTEKEIVTDVSKSIRSIKTLNKKSTKNEKIQDWQTKKFEGEQKKYAYGRSSSDVVIRYQGDVLTASIDLLQSLVDFEKAIIDLKRAQNSILDEVDWITYEEVSE